MAALVALALLAGCITPSRDYKLDRLIGNFALDGQAAINLTAMAETLLVSDIWI